MTAGYCRSHQAIAGIGDQGHARVGDERHALALGERAQKARLRGILRRIAVGHGRNRDAVVAGQPGEDPRVLAGDQVDGAQHVECAQGDVAQVADRGRDDMQARPYPLFWPLLPPLFLSPIRRRFTLGLPAASL